MLSIGLTGAWEVITYVSSLLIAHWQHVEESFTNLKSFQQ